MLSQGKVTQAFGIIRLFEVVLPRTRSWYSQYVFEKSLLKQEKYLRLTDIEKLPKRCTDKPYIRGKVFCVDVRNKTLDTIT